MPKTYDELSDLNTSSKLDLDFDPNYQDFDDSAIQMSTMMETSYMTSASSRLDRDQQSDAQSSKKSGGDRSRNSGEAASIDLPRVESASAQSSRSSHSPASMSRGTSVQSRSVSRSVSSKSSRSSQSQNSSRPSSRSSSRSSRRSSQGGASIQSNSTKSSNSSASSVVNSVIQSSNGSESSAIMVDNSDRSPEDGELNNLSFNKKTREGRSKNSRHGTNYTNSSQSRSNSRNHQQKQQKVDNNTEERRYSPQRYSRSHTNSRSRTNSPHPIDEAGFLDLSIRTPSLGDGADSISDKSSKGERSMTPERYHRDNQPIYNYAGGINKGGELLNGGSKNTYPNRGLDRENTYSTLDTSSQAAEFLPNVNVLNKKLVKIKLWNPDDTDKEQQQSVVSVAMDALTKSDELNNSKDMNCQVGRQIQLCHNGELIVGNSDMGENTVNVSWIPPSSLQHEQDEKDSSWEAPFSLTDDDKERAEIISRKLENPQPEEPQPPKQQRRPNSELKASMLSHTTGSSSVKGLEPFTIPSIISCTVVKETPASKVGLAFRKANGVVVIEKIGNGSPFEGKDLKVGHECLSINGHRLRSARRAAEIVRNSTSLTLLASNASRPPGTMYTMISLKDQSGSLSKGRDHAVGMHFKMKHGLVQMIKASSDSPISSTSMRVNDFVLAINGSVIGSISHAVAVLSDVSSGDDIVPILYFNMRQLRVSLVDKVIGEQWKKEWSSAYDECVVSQQSKGLTNPVTLKFKEGGRCELLDRYGTTSIPPEHPLISVVETLNHGIMCVLSAIREGVELVTTDVLMERRRK